MIKTPSRRKPITTTYQVPAHYAPYLINNDPSGLTDEDKRKIDDFLYRKHVRVVTIKDMDNEPQLTGYNDLDGAIIANTYEFICEELPRLHKGGPVISDERARQLCAQWSGHTNNVLYPLSLIGDWKAHRAIFYINAVLDAIYDQEKVIKPYHHTAKDLRALNSLKRYFIYKAEENAVWIRHYKNSDGFEYVIKY